MVKDVLGVRIIQLLTRYENLKLDIKLVTYSNFLHSFARISSNNKRRIFKRFVSYFRKVVQGVLGEVVRTRNLLDEIGYH